jgi:hypothetical protein
MPVPPREVYTFTVQQSIGCSTSLPGLQQQANMNSQSSVAVVGLLPGEFTSPTTSLTWREFLTGLTTYFFNPRALKTRLFKPTGLTTFFFCPAPKSNG